MKTFISFFIFLISCFAPAQAINFAAPAQIGSYSNPIEPIKPKAKTYKFWKKPIESKKQYSDSILISWICILGLIFIGGLIVFSIGFLQGIAFLLGLGLAAEIVWVLGLLFVMMAWANGDDVTDIPFTTVIVSFLASLFIKGGLLVVLGVLASILSAWVTGIVLLAIVLVFVSLWWANY